jgi:hypothetical protein
MSLTNLNLFENLLYAVFQSPWVFFIVILLMFLYYSVVYDISKNGILMFIVLFSLWFSFFLGNWVFPITITGVTIYYIFFR